MATTEGVLIANSSAHRAKDFSKRHFANLYRVLNEGHRRPVEVLDFGVCGFDDVTLVRRVRAAAVAESEMFGRQLERFTGEARVAVAQ